MKSFLKRLREMNVRRCETKYFPLNHWSVLEWAAAAAGECGEAVNVAKKLRRGDMLINGNQQLADEVADTIIYLDLLCASRGIDLEQAIARKFNVVSQKVGYEDSLFPTKEES